MTSDSWETAPAVSTEDIESVTNPSPAFWIWVWDAFTSGTIGWFVAAAMHIGAAESVRSALAYLNNQCESFPESLPHVTVSDLTTGRRGGRVTALAQALTGREVGQPNRYLPAGSIGHKMIGDFLVGGLGRLSKPSASRAKQLSLFADEAESPSQPLEASAQKTRRLASVERQWRRMAPLIRRKDQLIFGTDDWAGWRASLGWLNRLRRTMQAVCPEAMAELSHRCGAGWTDQTALSVLSWASAISGYRRAIGRRPRVLYREIPVTDFGHHLNGGRIDALEIREINGRPPTRRQRELLRSLLAQRFQSSGQLLWYLHRLLGWKKLKVGIIDWKFLVGDVLTSPASVTPDLVSSPMGSHVQQLERYLTLVLLDYYFTRGATGNLWSPDSLELEGELWYLLPDRQPVIHRTVLGPDESRDRFIRLVVERWPKAIRRARIRQVTNAMVGQLVGEVNNGNGHAHCGSRVNGHNGHSLDRSVQLGIFAEGGEPRTVHELVAQHQAELQQELPGSYGIIFAQGVDEQGRPQYLMSLQALINGIGRGVVTPSQGFDPADGGKVCCVFPDHDERTPSMHIYIAQYPPRAFCFGCERYAKIDPGSIPQNVVIACAEAWKQRRQHVQRVIQKGEKLQETEASAEHQAIMGDAQLLLAAALPGSRGETYVHRERRINPDLFLEYGGGYGTDELVAGLLDRGYSYDQLYFYGFVKASSRITPDHRLVGMLLGRGFTLEQLSRPIVRSGRATKELGLPYCVLGNRVTVPLGLSTGYDNFYGRAIFPTGKIGRHIKLSNVHTRVAQGGFRMELLQQAGGELIVTEAALDALTLMQIGYPAVMSMIGVGNASITRRLAQSGRALATGFDTDPTGIAKAQKLAETLAALGYQQPIRNFSETFFGRVGNTAKDFNGWWQEIGHRLPVDELPSGM